MSGDVWLALSVKCWTCGRQIKLRTPGGAQRRHWCRLHWFARAKWAAELDGWHSGYRWAAENPNDPLVAADRDDYGRGWAGHMRVGHLTVTCGESEGQA